jgi:hypothetical protein
VHANAPSYAHVDSVALDRLDMQPQTTIETPQPPSVWWPMVPAKLPDLPASPIVPEPSASWSSSHHAFHEICGDQPERRAQLEREIEAQRQRAQEAIKRLEAAERKYRAIMRTSQEQERKAHELIKQLEATKPRSP